MFFFYFYFIFYTVERKIQEQEGTIKKEEFVIKPTFKPRQKSACEEVTYDWHDHTEHILVFFLVMSQLNSKCKGH